MLKETFLPGKAFLSFIVTLLTISVFFSLISTLSDYAIYGLKYHINFGEDSTLNKPFVILYIYFIIAFVGIFYFFIFFLILLLEFFYRYYNLAFWIFLSGSVIIACFVSWYFFHGGEEKRIKNTICLIIAGIAYPFISNFWARKIGFIKVQEIK